MSILVVGSIALDHVETPLGCREDALGGACTYFATAASLYDRVHVVGVVGNDFPQEHLRFFESRGIDLRGLQVADGRTFRWAGRYGQDLGDAETLDTQLNVFGDFHPVLPPGADEAPFVFLANIDPDLQIEVLQQVRAPRLTALDSMNFWMHSKRDALTRALRMVDIVLLNESEVRLYAGEANLLLAARAILSLGPRALVIKRGEHGATLVTASAGADGLFIAPAYPVETVVDPTGAGDTFAAGFMGYLARSGDLSARGLRRALVHGAVVASFTVEDFSIDRLRSLTLEQIEARYRTLRWMTHFDSLSLTETGLLSRPVGAG